MSVRWIHGAWWVDCRLEGKRLRKRSPENTRRGAQAYEAELRRRVARGEPLELELEPAVIEPELTYAEFVPEWVDTYVVANCKHSEVLAKDSVLRANLIPWFGATPLSQIDALLVEKYKADKIRNGLSNKTINNHLTTLSKSLKCAAEWGRMKTPAPSVQRLRVCTPRIDFLTPVESHQLLRDREEPMWNIMILVALRTGMRFGELLGLEWIDINVSALRSSGADLSERLHAPRHDNRRDLGRARSGMEAERADRVRVLREA